MISLRQVVKRYGTFEALAPLTLEVAPRERVVLLGPSGSGKSTVLRLVLGLISPSEGEVFVAGEPMGPDTRLRLRRKIGYVAQGGGLFPHLTAFDNAALLPRHLGWDAERISARVKELGALTRLEPELFGRYPAELSGGQAQRVGLVRALMLDPPCLLMDEPLGALDPITRAHLQDDLASLFRALGKTVLFVTHDLAEGALLADRLVLLREGRVVQAGSFAELATRPADPFVTEFVRAHRTLPETPR